MDAAAVTALAAVVDHDQARVLSQLLQENMELRQQLEQQRQQLEQQRQQLDKQHQELEHQWELLDRQQAQIHRQGLHEIALSFAINASASDLRAGNVAAARERLYDYATC